MVTQTLKCDICEKEVALGTKDLQVVGGMNGFYEKEFDVEVDGKVEKEAKVMQYSFDFCPECNKKMVEHYFKLGGK